MLEKGRNGGPAERWSDPVEDPGPVGRPEADIEAALRAHFGDVPTDVDHDALSARIVAAAQLRLRARAKRAGWRAPASRWARIAIPTGLAASIALIFGLALADGDAPAGAVGLEEVVAVAASEGLPSDPLVVSDQEVFLSAVLSGE